MSSVTLDLSGDAKNIVDSFGKAADSVEELNNETKEFDKNSKKAFSDATKASTAFGKSVDDTVNKQKKEVGILQQIENDLKDLKKARLAANDTASIKKLNKEIDNQEKKMNKLTGTVKRTGFSFKEIAKGALAFTGITAGIAGVQAGFKRVIGTVADYDQATSQLKAITGLSDDQFKDFDLAIKRTAANTKKSGVDVAKAFQLIGSAQPELLKSADALAAVTESAITLAKAGGLDVPVAADALTKAMNQFGASADDAAMFTDILATSQQKGTATISQLADSLTNVGAVANAAGISFEDTNVALQALAKGGLVGAEAGTALRGVYSKLANQSRDELNPTLTSQKDIIATLSKENIGLKEATDLVGESSAKALLTLIAQEDTLNSLTGALNEQGNAQDQAATATANVNDRWDEFNATIDNAIIQFGTGESAISGFISQVIAVGTEILDLITGNEKLESTLSDAEKKTRSIAQTFITFVKVLGTVIAAYKAYQLALKLGLAIQKAITLASNAWAIAQKAIQIGLKAAKAAQLAFNAAAAANPIGLLIVVLLAAVAAFAAFAGGADEAAAAQESLNSANERASRIAKKRIAQINEQTAVQLKALNDEKILRAAAGEDQKKLDAEFLKRQEDLLAKEKLNNAKRRKAVAESAQQQVKDVNAALEANEKAQEENSDITIANLTSTGNVTQQIRKKQLDDERLALIKKRATIIGSGQGILKELKVQDKQLAVQISDAQRDQQVIVNEGQKGLSDEQKKAAEKRAADKEKELKRLLALEKRFQADLAKLALDAENAEIENLKGEEKFIAIEEQRNREIDLIRENLKKQGQEIAKGVAEAQERARGANKEQIEIAGQAAAESFGLTKEQLEQLQILRDKAAKERVTSTLKFNDEQLKAQEDGAKKSLDLQEQTRIEEVAQFNDPSLSQVELERSKQIQILEIQAEFAQKRIDLLGDNLSEENQLVKLQLQNQINDVQNQRDKLNDDANEKGFSMAKLLGVTDEEFEGIKEAMNTITGAVLEATQNLFAEQQEANEALIDGLTERIDEVEGELDRELELHEQGFASNVAGKQAELAALKAEREKAQKDQESLAKKQFALDTAIQASSLITSAANIIKATSSITPPFGQILAGIAIGAIAALFISARVKAFQAIKSGGGQAETGASGKGKTGRIHGKRHVHGGEHFTDHIEVEEGEPWAVLSRTVNDKDADKFHAFAEGLNAGKRPQDLIDKLLTGTGVVLNKQTPKKIEAKRNLVIHKTAQSNADMISGKMVEILASVDGNLDDFKNFVRNKKQIIPTPWGRIEIENGKQTNIRTKDLKE